MKLGRLEKLDLRTYWKREATEFTPWLAQKDNIQLLSETIGIDLEVVGQEESVGPFSADILCKDTLNDHFVLIENQLEKTDHTHLGQLLTYAAGLDAVTIIWIAQKFTEEHRATLDWLNRITDDQFTFFGIEIELYRIGDSVPAPMFNIISKPNDWSKQVKRSTNSQPVTDTKLLQQEYWQGLKNYMESNKSFVKMQNPLLQHWTNIAIGRSHFSLSALVNSRDNSISINLNITGDDAKDNYDKLYNIAYNGSLTEISNEIIWDKLESRKMSIVMLRTSGNFTNKNDWDNQFQWFKEYIEKFTTFFKPIIAKI
ncbi:MAG: DUF4268 domain-containing protein [Candidatus Kapaibacterium sp.]|nr:DUF4268 domain-containing protein [Bacteroidota bacterium]